MPNRDLPLALVSTLFPVTQTFHRGSFTLLLKYILYKFPWRRFFGDSSGFICPNTHLFYNSERKTTVNRILGWRSFLWVHWRLYYTTVLSQNADRKSSEPLLYGLSVFCSVSILRFLSLSPSQSLLFFFFSCTKSRCDLKNTWTH